MAAGTRVARPLLLVAGVLLAVAVGAGGWWWLTDRSSTGATDEQAGDGAAADEELERLMQLLDDPREYADEPEQADEVAVALAALSDDDDLAAATAPGTLDEIDGQLSGLPDGAVITPEPETWYRQGNRAALVVGVDLEDAESTDHFLVWLLRDGEGSPWLISHTEHLDEEAP